MDRKTLEAVMAASARRAKGRKLRRKQDGFISWAHEHREEIEAEVRTKLSARRMKPEYRAALQGQLEALAANRPMPAPSIPWLDEAVAMLNEQSAEERQLTLAKVTQHYGPAVAVYLRTHVDSPPEKRAEIEAWFDANIGPGYSAADWTTHQVHYHLWGSPEGYSNRQLAWFYRQLEMSADRRSRAVASVLRRTMAAARGVKLEEDLGRSDEEFTEAMKELEP